MWIIILISICAIFFLAALNCEFKADMEQDLRKSIEWRFRGLHYAMCQNTILIAIALMFLTDFIKDIMK